MKFGPNSVNIGHTEDPNIPKRSGERARSNGIDPRFLENPLVQRCLKLCLTEAKPS